MGLRGREKSDRWPQPTSARSAVRSIVQNDVLYIEYVECVHRVGLSQLTNHLALSVVVIRSSIMPSPLNHIVQSYSNTKTVKTQAPNCVQTSLGPKHQPLPETIQKLQTRMRKHPEKFFKNKTKRKIKNGCENKPIISAAIY